MQPQIVHVAVALIWRAETLLVTHRTADVPEGNLWEFPGGKRDPGESIEDAVRRECQEELGVRVQTHGIAWQSDHDAHGKRLALTFFHASIAADAEPKPLVAQALAWRTAEQLRTLPFCSGDAGLIEAIVAGKIVPPLR